MVATPKALCSLPTLAVVISSLMFLPLVNLIAVVILVMRPHMLLEFHFLNKLFRAFHKSTYFFGLYSPLMALTDYEAAHETKSKTRCA